MWCSWWITTYCILKHCRELLLSSTPIVALIFPRLTICICHIDSNVTFKWGDAWLNFIFSVWEVERTQGYGLMHVFSAVGFPELFVMPKCWAKKKRRLPLSFYFSRVILFCYYSQFLPTFSLPLIFFLKYWSLFPIMSVVTPIIKTSLHFSFPKLFL